MRKNVNESVKRKKSKKKMVQYRWIIKISITAFFLSMIFSFLSESIIPNVNMIFGSILLFLFIGLGILFDIIGVAVTSADEKPFHSMSARKVKGAFIAVMLKKNADKVSSFCNDVIGDICGIISGSAGAIIAVTLSSIWSIDPLIVSLVITALIASFTIGGKAMGKGLAISKSNAILYGFAKIISFVYYPKKKRKL